MGKFWMWVWCWVIMHGAAMGAQHKVVDSWEISKVPSGFPVGFCLLTHADQQYVAYFDEQHQMTVAARKLDSEQWIHQVLPSKVGWDSHNYMTMAVDDDGNLHVSGNMHADPLVYFRTEKPGDITSLVRLPMTGERELRATYPKFMRDHENRLIFNYRDGGSGRGVRLYNKYDPATKSWSRLIDGPLLDGEGERNAYPLGPVRGPGGWFHMLWVWRDTPDCATNHHLSYARSKDLIAWESAYGEKAKLPITLGQKALWVDPIPSGGGIINGGAKLFIDSRQRPVISYHKSDQNGHMQVFVARSEGREWKVQQLTEWSKPVHFSGNGSMGFVGIRISELSEVEPGLLTMDYHHRDYGSGRLLVDEQTLRPVDRELKFPAEFPAVMNRKRSQVAGMTIRRSNDIGGAGRAGVRYVLQWETLGPNRDRKRDGEEPEPSTLMLYKLVATGE